MGTNVKFREALNRKANMRKFAIAICLMSFFTSACAITNNKFRPAHEAAFPYLFYNEIEAAYPGQTMDGKIPSKPLKDLKKGEATTYGILGLIAFGDSSIDAAMYKGKISKIHHIDYQMESGGCLGFIIQAFTVIVYGE